MSIGMTITPFYERNTRMHLVLLRQIQEVRQNQRGRTSICRPNMDLSHMKESRKQGLNLECFENNKKY